MRHRRAVRRRIGDQAGKVVAWLGAPIGCDASKNVTQRILLADYLKGIIMNQDVPPDLLGQARESRFFNQYCPGNAGWLCRPADLSGTDLTFAFEKG